MYQQQKKCQLDWLTDGDINFKLGRSYHHGRESRDTVSRSLGQTEWKNQTLSRRFSVVEICKIERAD